MCSLNCSAVFDVIFENKLYTSSVWNKNETMKIALGYSKWILALCLNLAGLITDPQTLCTQAPGLIDASPCAQTLYNAALSLKNKNKRVACETFATFTKKTTNTFESQSILNWRTFKLKSDILEMNLLRWRCPGKNMWTWCDCSVYLLVTHYNKCVVILKHCLQSFSCSENIIC